MNPPEKTEAYQPPERELEAFARCILPAMEAYFQSEQGKKEFAEWREREENSQKKNDAE